MISFLYMIVSGVLLSLSLSNPQLFFISWIAFLPVIAGLKNKNLKEAFVNGWLFGIVILTGSAYWLYYPLLDFSGLPQILILLILALLFILMGLFYGIWALIYVYINGKNKIHPFLFAGTWVAVEFIRYRIISVYPLAFAAYTQTGFKFMIQLADVGGIFLVSFIILLINAYIYNLIKKGSLKFVIPVLIIIITVFTYGGYKLNYYSNKDYNTVTAGVFNTVVSQKNKWKNSWIEKNIDELVKAASKFKDTELIIGPETSLTFDIVRNEYYRNKFLKKADKIDSYLQVGAQSIKEGEIGKYNSVFLISPAGEIVDRYNKRKLVPFGEYIPFHNKLDILKEINVESLNKGEKKKVFKTPFASWETSICSEVFYPLIHKNNTDFIINHSNEAWYRDSNLHQQMWSAAVFRAVEYRSSVIRAGNYSWSGLIHPSGIYDDIYKGGEDYTIKIKINNESTLYQHWKNYMGWGAVIIIILALSIKLYRERKL